MPIELTDDMRQALAAQPGEPLHLVDPKTQEGFVVLPSELYENLVEKIEDEALQEAWLEMATKTRRAWVRANPY